MTIRINADRAIALVDQAVIVRGTDHVCQREDGGVRYVYARHGRPSCLVGQVLQLAGVPPRVLEDLRGPITTLDVPGARLTDGARDVLQIAQSIQDTGATWGEAAAAARAWLVDQSIAVDQLPVELALAARDEVPA